MLFLYCFGAVVIAPFIVYFLYNSTNKLEVDEIIFIAALGSIVYPITFSLVLGLYITKKVSKK